MLDLILTVAERSCFELRPLNLLPFTVGLYYQTLLIVRAQLCQLVSCTTMELISMLISNKNPAKLVSNHNGSDYSNINQECIELLKRCLSSSRSNYAKGGSVGSLMDNGRIDQPMKPLTMQPMQVMQKMRTMFSNGGRVDSDDESQILYLISVLEGGHLNPMEQQLLLELYDDLKKLGGSK